MSEFSRKAFVACGCLTAFVLVAFLIILSRRVLMLVFGAILFAVILQRLAKWVGRLFPIEVNRGIRVGTTLIVGVVLSGMVLLVFANSISEQVVALADRVDQSVNDVVQAAKDNPLIERLSEETSRLTTLLPSSTKSLGFAQSFFASAFGGLLDVVILIILSLYFCVDPERYQVGFLRMLPVDWRDRASELLNDSSDVLWRWMLGRWLAMLLVGILFATGLALIGVPMALELGVFAAAVTFIPNFGAIAAVLPALLLASSEGTTAVLAVLALYSAIQFGESYFITPLVQHHQLELPPALVILGQVLAGLVFGFWGIVFATPLVAIVILWIRELYVKQWLETRLVGESEKGEKLSH